MEGLEKEFFIIEVGGNVHGKTGNLCPEKKTEKGGGGTGMVSHSEAWGMAFSAYRRAVSPRKRKLSTRFCLPDRLSGISIMES